MLRWLFNRPPKKPVCREMVEIKDFGYTYPKVYTYADGGKVLYTPGTGFCDLETGAELCDAAHTRHFEDLRVFETKPAFYEDKS